MVAALQHGGGITDGQVAEALAVSRRTICRWLSRDRGEQSPKNRAASGRKNSVRHVAKSIIVKFILKREQLTKKNWIGG